MKKIRLTELILYFLKLGAIGFGGSIAIAHMIRKDLVDKKHWITNEEFLRGLTISELTPGPLAAQLAMYVGYITRGIIGTTLTGLSFILPSFVLVTFLSFLYFQFNRIPQIQYALYGIGAAAIGIIAASAIELMSKILKPKFLLFLIFVVMFLFTALLKRTSVILFVLSGILTMSVYSKERLVIKRNIPTLAILAAPLATLSALLPLERLFVFFLQAGALAFGGGLGIIPFLHTGVVGELHWLTNKQFIDAMSIAMITPGPVAISATFIGYRVAGITGAIVATTAIFLPVYFLVIVLTPFFVKYSENPRLIAFVEGVTSAAMGAIGGSVILLGQGALTNMTTVLIAIVSFALFKFLKVQGALIILLAGIFTVMLSTFPQMGL